ncbi:hypothetical protein [Neptuniibacter caesariensis]|uniref:hypothetical protein n=1 Tax=Neptuniibacter caesariensis TaxID=207954 RepID=UPI0012B6A709|nr:hypothetical protein [Neptuniibacter caesariensis]
MIELKHRIDTDNWQKWFSFVWGGEEWDENGAFGIIRCAPLSRFARLEPNRGVIR